MIFEKTDSKIRSVDPGLVGLWRNGASSYRVENDGRYYVVNATRPFSISADGQTLTFDNPTSVFVRTMGSGSSLVGVWEKTIADGADRWMEECIFRANKTYTGQVTLNGNYDSEFQGTYNDTSSHIVLDELRAVIETATPDLLTFHDVNSVCHPGVYEINPSGDKWTFHSGASDVVYTRAA